MGREAGSVNIWPLGIDLCVLFDKNSNFIFSSSSFFFFIEIPMVFVILAMYHNQTLSAERHSNKPSNRLFIF
jgi:hypothetical protein